MNKTDLELSKVIDSAVNSNIDFSKDSSLEEIYNKKKESLKLSDRQIQKILGMDPKTLKPILNGEAKQINIINVIKLGHFLGLSVSDLLKVYIPQMDIKQIGEIQRARDAGYIAEHFDIATLLKIKFFTKGSSSKEMADKIKKFFNLDSLYEYSEKFPKAFFSSTKKNSDDKIRDFWVKSAILQFRLIENPNSYKREELITILPNLKPYTRDIKYGLVKVLKILYHLGITVIFQPSIQKLQIRGATMLVGNKPCIVLSDHNKNYPTLWFTLFHEISHVLFDLDDINRITYHISGPKDELFLLNEEKADDFAKNYLINESNFKYVSGYITSDYNINIFAKKLGIHPSIIYAIYCYKTKEWPFYKKYIPTMTEAIKLINTYPFEKDDIIESVKEIKELIYN